MAAQQITIQELLQIVQQQQTQIGQLLAANANAGNGNAAAINQQIIPPLNDIILFESSNDKSRISDWIDRFTFAIDCAAPNLDDKMKVKMMMNKLTENSFAEYAKFVLPKSVTDFSFDETKANMMKLFSRQQSIFVDRYDCLKATKEDNEDFKTFINRHKMLLRNFEFSKMNEEQFMVLMLLLALKAPKDTALRQRILTKLSQDGDTITYENVVEDCINFMSTIAESRIVEMPMDKSVNMMTKKGKGQGKKTNDGGRRDRQPSTTDEDDEAHQKQCWRCGGRNHSHANCRHKTSKCHECGEVGHLRPKCNDVQQWKRKNGKSNAKNVGNVRIGTVIKMNGNDSTPHGLWSTIKFNGQPIKFKLDCGTEAIVVNEGTQKLMGSPGIRKCSEQGQTYDGTLIPFIGKSNGTFEFDGKMFKSDYYVAEKGSMNLLGINGMDAFGLMNELKMKINGLKINNENSGNKNEIMMSNKKSGNDNEMMKTAAIRPQHQFKMKKSSRNEPRKQVNINEMRASRAFQQSIKAASIKMMENPHQKWNRRQMENSQFHHLKKGEEEPPHGMKKKAQRFAIGEEVLAWHRPTQEWLDGGISRRKGFLYDVIFSDGFTSRFHVSRLRKIESQEDDQWSKMNNENFIKIPTNDGSEPELSEPEPNEFNDETSKWNTQ
jgi:hypothetical protein